MSAQSLQVRAVLSIRLFTLFFAFTLVLSAVLSPPSTLSASTVTPLSWTTRAPMPTARLGVGVAVAPNDTIYSIGGFNTPWNDASGKLAVVEAYDPLTNTWVTRVPMPTARGWAGVATASNGKIYAVGGWNGAALGTVEEYDPTTNIWTTKTSMPTPRWNLGVAAGKNGKLYAIGGQLPGFPYTATVEEYDPATDTWTPRRSMATVRGYLGVATASNGKIYAVGGWNNGPYLDTVEEYDPTTNIWTAKTSMPTPRCCVGLAAGSNGKLYAIGGENTRSGNLLATVEEYDPATDAWASQTNMPTPRGPAVATSNEKIYAIGGADSGGRMLAMVEEATTGASISGRVTDANSSPIVGLTISTQAGQTTTTDSDGGYTIRGLPPGTYTITPAQDGYSFAPSARTATVPPDQVSQDFVATSLPDLDYFALGDSIASGHGLGADSTSCQRSVTRAYPFKVRNYLQARYNVEFPLEHFLACSGATAGPPAPEKLQEDQNKWLHNQVSYVLEHLSTSPALISITIGGNDVALADQTSLVSHLLFDSDAAYKKWVKDRTTQAARNVNAQVFRLLERPNTSVVITTVGNPMNRRSNFWAGYPSQDVCGGSKDRCYDRTEVLIHTLNDALSSMRVLRQANRATLTLDLHQHFHNHESPMSVQGITRCGDSPPTATDTWVQYPGELNINSKLPATIRLATGISEPFGDCIHPNDRGAEQYAKAVHEAAITIGR